MDRPRKSIEIRLAERRERRKSDSGASQSSSDLYTGQIYEVSDDDVSFLGREAPPNFKEQWRKGHISLPGVLSPFRLFSMESRLLFSMIRSTGDPTAVGKLWSPSIFLSLVLSCSFNIVKPLIEKHWFRGNSIVEVGAGWAGVPGLVLGRLGARNVILTDGEMVMVDNLQLNAIAEERTLAEFQTSNEHACITSAQLLRWGNVEDARNLLRNANLSKMDVLVACDALYAEPEALLNTASELLRCNRLLLCWESRPHRIDEENKFFSLLPTLGYINRVIYVRDALSHIQKDPQILQDGIYSSQLRDACVCVRNHMDNQQGELCLLAIEKEG